MKCNIFLIIGIFICASTHINSIQCFNIKPSEGEFEGEGDDEDSSAYEMYTATHYTDRLQKLSPEHQFTFAQLRNHVDESHNPVLQAKKRINMLSRCEKLNNDQVKEFNQLKIAFHKANPSAKAIQRFENSIQILEAIEEGH